jgi:hypothetical protein
MKIKQETQTGANVNTHTVEVFGDNLMSETQLINGVVFHSKIKIYD